MPYIEQRERDEFDRSIEALYVNTPGKLAYGVSRLISKFLRASGSWKFIDFAIVIGVLAASMLEFYRRVVAPYEDRKNEENGDIRYTN